MDRQLDAARTLVIAWVQGHPQLELSDEAPEFQGHTNRVLLGSFEGQPVVYKVFVTPERKRHEKKMLLQMAASGTVPRLYPLETDSILVLERLPGAALHGNLSRLTPSEQQATFRQIGGAFALIATAAQTRTIPASRSNSNSPLVCLPGVDLDFYWNAPLPVLFGHVVETGGRALAEREVPEAEMLSRLLDQFARCQRSLLAYPTFVHQDDVHLNNLIVEGTAFRGFVDLEMCREGNEVLLLAAALALCRNWPWLWPPLRAGYEAERGSQLDAQTLSLARDMTTFSEFIRFSWYRGTDALPQWAVDGNLRQATVNKIKKVATLTSAITL